MNYEFIESEKQLRKTEYESYRSSTNSLFQEKKTQVKKEGLAEYDSTETEKKMKQPEGIFHGESQTGTVSFGKNEKSQMYIAIGAKEPVDTKGKEKDSKMLKAEGSHRLHQYPEEVLVNGHEPKDSAVLMKIQYNNKAPEAIVKKLKRMVQEKDTYAQRALPFLNEKQQLEEKKYLERMREAFHTEENERLYDAIQKKLDCVRNDLQHREREEKKFLEKIKQSVAQMKQQDKTNNQGIKRKMLLEEMEGVENPKNTDDTEADSDSKRKQSTKKHNNPTKLS